MDLLKSALEASKQRKRNATTISTVAAAAATASAPIIKRFKSRGEIESEQRQRELLLQQNKNSINNKQSNNNTNIGSESINPTINNNLDQSVSASASTAAAVGASLNVFEVQKRLRAYSQPITLFGESEIERYNRLHSYELTELDQLSHRTIQTQAIINRNKLKELDTELSLANQQDQQQQQQQQQSIVLQPPKSTINQLIRSDYSKLEDYLYEFFKRLLSKWDYLLQSRTSNEKQSLDGRKSLETFKQTKEWLKPLLKQLKHSNSHSSSSTVIKSDLLLQIELLVNNCINQQYNLANQTYLTLAIGNAPWPMGVTMVGIHERSGRERLNDRNIAHVLNDETTRKYIQAIKRCITHLEQTQNSNNNSSTTHSTQ